MHSIYRNTHTRLLVALALAVSVVSLVMLPGFASAATYAYVNQSGEVRMVTADTPTIAMSIAPSIHIRSGVLLLNSLADNEVIGDNVAGI